MAQLERSAFIELLNRLGARSDEEALAAARELHETVTANGVKWDDLLIPDSRTTAARAEPEEAEDPVDEDGPLDEEAAPDEQEDAVEPAGEDDRSQDDDDEEEEEEQEEEGEQEEEDDEDEEEEEEEEAAEGSAAVAKDPGEPLAPEPQEAARIVDRLLARKSLSKEMRDELAGFQRDIAAGRLADMDSRYIVALAKRFGV
jgi:hypothetical protein